MVLHYRSWRIWRFPDERLQETGAGADNDNVYNNFETIEVMKIMVGTGMAWRL